MTLDFTKPLRTKSGLSARVVDTKVMGPRPRILVLLTLDNAQEAAYMYEASGSYFQTFGHDLDLINVLVLEKCYKVLTCSELSQPVTSLEAAIRIADYQRYGHLLAVLEFVYEDDALVSWGQVHTFGDQDSIPNVTPGMALA